MATFSLSHDVIFFMVSPLLGRFLVSFNQYNLQSVVCSLWSAVCSLQSSVCSLQSAVCSLQSAVCSLRSAVCSLQSAVCKCHTPNERCHAACEGHNVQQACSEVEKEASETLFIQKNRSVFWPGTFLEDCLSQHLVDCAAEDCLSHRYVKFYL